MDLKSRQQYMNDFANLLMELDTIKKHIERVEKILPRLNAEYFEKDKSDEVPTIAK